MVIYRLAKLAFVAATLFGESVTVRAGCSNPIVRQEWRSLTRHERAEWIAAVKVDSAVHPSRVTDTFPPSVFMNYLTTLL